MYLAKFQSILRYQETLEAIDALLIKEAWDLLAMSSPIRAGDKVVIGVVEFVVTGFEIKARRGPVQAWVYGTVVSGSMEQSTGIPVGVPIGMVKFLSQCPEFVKFMEAGA